MRILLIDPSLFTAPYDAGLTAGLTSAGVECAWGIRPLRAQERQELAASIAKPLFYRTSEQSKWLPAKLKNVAKGLGHLTGWWRLLAEIKRTNPDVLHVQWTVLPLIDALGMRYLKRRLPIVLTVHDTLPFNGQATAFLQRAGFKEPMKLADRIIVHTKSAAATLIKQGIDEKKIRVVPHGPLSPPQPLRAASTKSRDARFTFVLFGLLKTYKGVDVLVEALGLMPLAARNKLRVIVAGDPVMDMAPILRRIEELGISSHIDLRMGRLSDEQMADLFEEADSFVFPYRHIDASGVYYLVRPLQKWMIASAVGVFAEDFQEDIDGQLVKAGDPQDLAHAMQRCLDGIPNNRPGAGGASWPQIGAMTKSIYGELLAERGPPRPTAL